MHPSSECALRAASNKDACHESDRRNWKNMDSSFISVNCGCKQCWFTLPAMKEKCRLDPISFPQPLQGALAHFRNDMFRFGRSTNFVLPFLIETPNLLHGAAAALPHGVRFWYSGSGIAI